MITQKEKTTQYQVANEYLDSLFPLIPVDAPFNVSSLILESDISESKKIIGNDLSDTIEHLLRKYGYINELDKEHFWYTLSEIGIEAKRYGGHTTYQDQIFELKLLTQKKLQIDLKNAIRINSTYWWTFTFSVLGLLLALGKIIYDIYKK
jgi:hypothetical protein